MAPKNGRGRKKKEEKVLPLEMDIKLNLPDETHVILKGISTDRIIDVRRLISVDITTCNIDNFSLSHEVRGPHLKDTVDVSALKPCTLTLVEEDYDEWSAKAHVRRLLDIVACTTSFGPSANKDSSPPAASKGGDAGKETKASKKANNSPPPAAGDSASKVGSSAAFDGDGELNNTSPKLGSFYEFFSLSHLTPPLQFIRRATKKTCDGLNVADHLFTLEVKLCNGKLIHIEASRKGFYSTGKQQIICHSLVDLLRQLSRAFDNAYGELMKALSERNKYGNRPFGYRSNTWLVPPVAAKSPSTFHPLPMEDEKWGGNGGGLGRDGKSDLLPYANEFLFLVSIPCKTAEERQIRDRKAFLLHSLFVDVAIFRAIAAVQYVMRSSELAHSSSNGQIIWSEKIGDLNIAVVKDASNASCKVDNKIDGQRALGLDKKKLDVRNLLKGITTDENTATRDIATLGIVNVRYCGYTATVKVEGINSDNVNHPLKSQVLLGHLDGGANALNINSLRLLLHENVTPEQNKVTSCEGFGSSEDFVKRLLEESLSKLQEENMDKDSSGRWELGACWIKHLQCQRKTEKEKKTSDGKSKNEMKVEGLGKPLKSLKSKKNNSDRSNIAEMQTEVKDETKKDINVLESQTDTKTSENELVLKALLSNSAFTRLKESETGLHAKSLHELIELSEKYYDEVALPKLVADFGSLDLSPVDGRTLTDFMHTRGLRMRSLGQVVKLSEKLSHVQSLCIHEMVVRAFKHILLAVISAIEKPEKMAAAIAATLNLMLGVPENEHLDQAYGVSSTVWRWLEVFLKKRYEWNLSKSNYKDLRKFVILRGLCHKVGIELVPRDFDMKCAHPFQKVDIVALVPVHKQVACSSADARQLLESSKTALDKGKLEEAVTYGTKALATLVAVCGPYHRMTAGAYSLLSVVLFHTGDFNQATIYQQKALDINERELGLDHPDTMKSYGDLAVFYYKLQHMELALKYVKRALYLLHLTCGPSHPNTAATYINVAMMEEGLGNVHVALRYLHKALKCNQMVLGPDHIQTAGSYHAIAIALSLMEAYPLSVQHEQKNLQIVRAKLGPDDIRTKDAAAWLEHFESKALEQQEAAKNGTRKPDASIASKGHLSVSDLLDYISPSLDAKRKDAVGSRRKNYVAKAMANPLQPISDSEVTPKESVELGLTEANITKVPLPKEPVVESPPISIGLSPEGEDGWQPVHRPRAAGSFSKQPKHPSKIINHQKKDIIADVEHYVSKNPSSVSKFRQKVVKTPLAHRVKSLPTPILGPTVEGEKLHSASDPMPNKRTSMVSLGKSPSYKEVALAPPGTIPTLQSNLPENDQEVKTVEDLLVGPTPQLTDAKEENNEKEKIHSNDDGKVICGPESNEMGPTDDSKTSSEVVKSSAVDLIDSKEEAPNKKLSASAAPYNPSPRIPMSIPIPNGPWPNVSILPGPMSPPFMFLPYMQQPHSIPPNTFQITSRNLYHQGQLTWQWSVVEPIPKPVLETKEESVVVTKPENQNPVPNLPVELNAKNESKKEMEPQSSEAVESLNHREEKTDKGFLSNDECHVQGQECKVENEKTLNILVRGRRSKKQMLRMPMSLLKRPYSSQSFKVTCNRVIREGEVPRSTGLDTEEADTDAQTIQQEG